MMSELKTKNYFVVSKPLQYVNSTNISVEGRKILVLVELFVDASFFFSQVKKSGYWDECYSFKHSQEAYRFLRESLCKDDNLYIDSDFGVKKQWWLSKIKAKSMFVYEEGIGSYRSDLLSSRKISLFFKFILKFFFQIKGYFGGGRMVSGIYVYDHDKHQNLVPDFKKRRLNFDEPFLQHLEHIKHHFRYQESKIEEILNICKDRNVYLYLTSWQYEVRIAQAMLGDVKNGIRILKPHPHIRIQNVKECFDFIVDSDVIVELLILNLIKNNVLYVYHENSSALNYFDKEQLISNNFSHA